MGLVSKEVVLINKKPGVTNLTKLCLTRVSSFFAKFKDEEMCYEFCYAMIFFFAEKTISFNQHNTIMIIKVHLNPQ